MHSNLTCFKIFYSLISSIDKQALNVTGSPILIRCKHYLTCLFIISKERDCQTLYSTLLNYSRPGKVQHLQCFRPNEHLKFLEPIALSNNQKIFELASEYARMGVPNNEWSRTNLNQNYELCDTYVIKPWLKKCMLRFFFNQIIYFCSRTFYLCRARLVIRSFRPVLHFDLELGSQFYRTCTRTVPRFAAARSHCPALMRGLLRTSSSCSSY
jgi:hypothetical protein